MSLTSTQFSRAHAILARYPILVGAQFEGPDWNESGLESFPTRDVIDVDKDGREKRYASYLGRVEYTERSQEPALKVRYSDIVEFARLNHREVVTRDDIGDIGAATYELRSVSGGGYQSIAVHPVRQESMDRVANRLNPFKGLAQQMGWAVDTGTQEFILYAG